MLLTSHKLFAHFGLHDLAHIHQNMTEVSKQTLDEHEDIGVADEAHSFLHLSVEHWQEFEELTKVHN